MASKTIVISPARDSHTSGKAESPAILQDKVLSTDTRQKQGEVVAETSQGEMTSRADEHTDLSLLGFVGEYAEEKGPDQPSEPPP